jgi:hypothetical protein
VCSSDLVRRGNEEIRNKRHPGTPSRHETAAAIRLILYEDLNALLITIAETLSFSRETIRTHVSRIGYSLRSLRWILQALICELKWVRLSMYLQ